MLGRLANRGSPYRGYRFPPDVIAHAVWLYFRFHLSFRDVEELLAEREMIVSYETIRHWCYTFGPGYAADLQVHATAAPARGRCQ
jgi:putative transposase